VSKTNTGGPAFPLHNHGAQTLGLDVTGMTLRDYFAAKAMQSYMINEVWNPDTYKNAAYRCYRMADAMLKARQS